MVNPYNMFANTTKIWEKWHPSFFIKCYIMQPSEIEQLIVNGIPDCQALVEGDGTHFTAVVMSPAFIGKSRVQKQQLVYDTVRTQLLDGSLHALSIKAFTPTEWEALDAGDNQEGQ
jgi:acid stress-induced BolA-like protein IbaG/YrbA